MIDQGDGTNIEILLYTDLTSCYYASRGDSILLAIYTCLFVQLQCGMLLHTSATPHAAMLSHTYAMSETYFVDLVAFDCLVLLCFSFINFVAALAACMMSEGTIFPAFML